VIRAMRLAVMTPLLDGVLSKVRASDSREPRVDEGRSERTEGRSERTGPTLARGQAKAARE
jgi:hypothetical protein